MLKQEIAKAVWKGGVALALGAGGWLALG